MDNDYPEKSILKLLKQDLLRCGNSGSPFPHRSWWGNVCLWLFVLGVKWSVSLNPGWLQDGQNWCFKNNWEKKAACKELLWRSEAEGGLTPSMSRKMERRKGTGEESVRRGPKVYMCVYTCASLHMSAVIHVRHCTWGDPTEEGNILLKINK